ncbi:MAG: hypothetical protein ACI4S3_06500, partial [Candidatus Gastranaerophilaceae bacterium]
MQLKYNSIILLIFCFFIGNNVFSEQILTTDVVKTEQIEHSFNKNFKQNFSDAISKYENLNIKVSYDDFYKLIEQTKKGDYYLLLLANKTAEFGFFDLSNLAFSKITDVDISNSMLEDTKKFCYPAKSISQSDIIILAEL